MPHLKTMVVIADIEVDKVGSVELDAPIGVNVDLTTGDLTVPLRVEPVGDPVLKPTILPDKLINEGFQKAVLIMDLSKNEFFSHGEEALRVSMYLPIFSVTKIKGIRPDDDITEIPELEHVSVSGLPEFVAIGQTGLKVKIFVRALFKMRINIAREELTYLPEERSESHLIKDPPKSERTAQRPPANHGAYTSKPAKRKRRPKRSQQPAWNRFWR